MLNQFFLSLSFYNCCLICLGSFLEIIAYQTSGADQSTLLMLYCT